MNKQEKFPTRPGTVDFGKDYECLMSAYYSLLLSLDDSIVDFKLSTNNKDMGDFDDVVLEVDYGNGEEHLYALQLKHKEKKLTLAAFTGDAGKGKFNVIKYCEGYGKIRKKLKPNSTYNAKFEKFHFILYTNSALSKLVDYDDKGKEIDVGELKIPLSDLSIVKHDVCPAKNLLNVSNESDYVIFKFKANKDGAMDEEFLQQFLLYTKQMDAKEMERIINKMILDTYKNCDANVVTKYLNYFKYWCRGDFGTFKLTKSDVRIQLAELLITPYIPDIDFSKLERYGEKSELLERVINEFDVILIQNTQRQLVDKALGTMLGLFNIGNGQDGISWSSIFSYSEITSILKQKKIAIPIASQSENYQEWSLKKLYILAWHLDVTPLIIKSGEFSREIVTSAVNLCNNKRKKKKFVIFDKNISRNNFSDDWKVFLNLTDLLGNTQQLYRNICEKFQLSLQGRNAITLQQFVQNETVLHQVITVKELVEMLDNSFCIDKKTQELPKHYVTRYSPKILIRPEAIDAISSDVFVIIHQNDFKLQDCFTTHTVDINNYVLLQKSDCAGSYVPKFYDFMELKKNPEKFEKIVNTVVILAEGNCSQDQFDAISAINRNKNCHILRAVDPKRFEWIQSSGSVEKLRQYHIGFKDVQPNHFTTDTEIHQFRNNINILCADPGMGKSVAMDFLQQTCSSDNWAIKINLHNHIKFFKNITSYDSETILDYFVNLGNKSSLVGDVIKVFRAKKKIVFLWDGFDELPKSCMKSVITIIKSLASDGYVQWIAARNYSKDVLESAFDTFSITLTQFSDEDQQNYIKMRCEDQCDEFGYHFVEVLQVINKMYKNINVLYNRDDYHSYSGVPLQIYMVTEIFRQNPMKYMSEIKIVTVVDIYSEFIKGKFDFLFKKADANFENYQMQQIQEKFRKSILENYEIAALKATLDEVNFEKLGLNCEDLLNDIEEGGDNLGIIIGMGDEKKPVFAHKTYEEFLTASWLSKNCRNNKELVKNFFREEFSNVRLMFDMLLASESPVHLAVLLKNQKILENSKNTIATSRDKIGRNALHVICSWGQRYPLLEIVDNNSEKTIISTNNADNSEVENEDFLQVLSYLLGQQLDPFEKDEFFNWNAFEYADETLSLAVIEVLLENNVVELNELRNYSDHYTVLHYSIAFNLPNLFHAIKTKPYFEYREAARSSVLQIAAEFNRTSFITELVKIPKYQAAINYTNDNKGFPLYSAVYHNNLEVIETLLEHGARVNGMVQPPLNAAAFGGSINICEMLIQKGASVNDCDIAGHAPLWPAVVGNHFEITELLLKNGANVNFVDKTDLTVLDIAHHNDNLEILQLLLENGAEINRQTKSHGYTLLHSAAEYSDIRMLKYLLDVGADPKIKSTQLYTPLHVALIKSRKEVALELIKADPSVINELDNSNCCALHYAVLRNYEDVVEILLENGAEVDCCRTGFNTPLHLAVEGSSEACVETLLKAGASLDRLNSKGQPPLCATTKIEILKLLLNHSTNINIRSSRGATPLHFAAGRGAIESVKELIQRGAEIDLEDNNKTTPALNAITLNHPEILRCLLEHGAKIFNAATYLTSAVIAKSFDCIKILLEFGADVNARDEGGRTALHNASYFDSQWVKILLENGANWDVYDNNNYTPLMFAISAGKIDVVEVLIDFGAVADFRSLHVAAGCGNVVLLILLIEAGASVDGVDSYNNTAFHHATVSKQKTTGFVMLNNSYFMTTPFQLDGIYICNNYEECARELIARNASLNVQNSNKMTPLHMACMEKLSNFASLYVSSGADVAIPNQYNQTALHLSCIVGGLSEVELLLNHEASLEGVDDFGKTPLCYAIEYGHKEMIKFLVNSSENCDSGIITPLIMACCKNDLETIKILISHGVDVDKPGCVDKSFLTQNETGAGEKLSLLLKSNVCTENEKEVIDDDEKILPQLSDDYVTNIKPLVVALVYNNEELVDLLVNKGVDVKIVTKNGWTPLHFASYNNSKKLAKIFLNLEAEVNLKTNGGSTPLHLLLSNTDDNGNRFDLVKLLCEAEADVNCVDDFGNSLLHFPRVLKNHEIFNFLIEQSVEINLKNQKNFSPLHVACVGSCIEGERKSLIVAIKLLTANGADLNAIDSNGFTPLLYAIVSKNIDVIDILLDAKPNLELNIGGDTYLSKACEIGDFNCVKSLVLGGASVNITNGRSPLHVACSKKGNLEIVKILVTHGADVNFYEGDSNSFTPLLLAVYEGDEEVVNYLLINGANTNAVEKSKGCTPIMYAASGNYERILQNLFKNSANVNARDKSGCSAIHFAVSRGHPKIVRYLHQFGADLNSKNQIGRTALQLACLLKQNEAAKVLLELEVNLNETCEGFTALDTSITSSNIEMVKALMAKNAAISPSSSNHQLIVNNAITFNDVSILEYLQNHGVDLSTCERLLSSTIAISLGFVSILEYLLQNSGNSDDRFDERNSLLGIACYANQIDCAKCLLEHGANPNKILEVIDEPPLLISYKQENRELVKLLLKYEANIDQTNINGDTVLLLAIQRGNLNDVKLFYDSGANLLKQDDNGEIPLSWAVKGDDFEIAKFLIDKTVEINHKDHQGFTPLHQACMENKYSNVKLLIDAGSDPNIVNNNYLTPLHNCVVCGHVAIADLLLSNNADVSLGDATGATPLHYASYFNQLEIVKLFFDKFLNCGKENNSDTMADWKKSFFVAVQRNNIEIAIFFIENAIVNVNCVAEVNGFTALHYAGFSNSYETGCYLIEQGINVNTYDLEGFTPLCCCSYGGCLKLVQLLVENYNVDVNACNLNGNSSLFAASAKGFLDIVKFLHEHGAKIHVVDEAGDTPLHDAAAQGYLEIVEYLVENGADVDFKNNDGKTPLALANEKEHCDIVEFLKPKMSASYPCKYLA